MKNVRAFLGLMMLGTAISAPAMAGDTHFRWGVGGGLGYFVPANVVDFHGEFRAGAQLSEKFGIYGEVGFMAGFGIGGSVSSDGSSGTVRASVLGLYHLTPLVEYSFGAPFIAGGIQLGRGGWAYAAQSVSGDETSQIAIAAGGFLPGIDLRAGIVTGKARDDGRRKGFSMALDVKIMRAAYTEVGQSTSGGEIDQRYQVGKSAIGVTPTLMFGFDAK